MKTIYRLPILVLACWLCLSTAVWGSNPPPPPVTGLVVVHNGSTVPATWDAVDNIDGYHYQARIHGGSWWAIVPVPTMSQPTVTIQAAEAGREYDVRVRTHKDGVGTSAWRSASARPPAVTGLAAVHHGGYVTATWTAPAVADGVHATWRYANSNHWYRVSNPQAASLRIDGLYPAFTIIVAVRVRTSGGHWGPWTNSAPAACSGASGACTPPGSVGSLTAVHNGTTVTVTWDAPAGGAVDYHVTYSTDGGGSWSLATHAATGTSLDITGTDAAKTYIVGVRARNANGYGPWTNSNQAVHE